MKAHTWLPAFSRAAKGLQLVVGEEQVEGYVTAVVIYSRKPRYGERAEKPVWLLSSGRCSNRRPLAPPWVCPLTFGLLFSVQQGQLAWLVLIVICGSSACRTWFSNKEHVLSVLQVNLLNTPLSVQSVLPPLNQGNCRKNCFKIPLWNAPWLYVCSIVFYSHQIFMFILLLIEFHKCQYCSLVFNSHYESLETPAIPTLSVLSDWFKDHFILWK